MFHFCCGHLLTENGNSITAPATFSEASANVKFHPLCRLRDAQYISNNADTYTAEVPKETMLTLALSEGNLSIQSILRLQRLVHKDLGPSGLLDLQS
ncbi:hypothetical protein TNIN_160891 [Trichonephila inaurata madagascariensis]|uniref:Uncharacterized protein n=1 Tax=Trichonephila inaurata madagascariensis TaxID=2747483 RepID=A0A8X6WWE9_9ARAC|nr:hypothetical protein TNIN_160891 [Trichonephila inaurata madagascariensis]